MRMRKIIEFAVVWISLFLSVFVGFILGINIINSIFCVLGWMLFVLGLYIHYLSHKVHPKAHRSVKEINYVAKYGIYSWIRHPGYLGLVLMFIGIAIAFGSILTLVTAIILSIYHYILAYKEEKLMLRKFGDTYARYMENVPYRFLPIRKLLRRLFKS